MSSLGTVRALGAAGLGVIVLTPALGLLLPKRRQTIGARTSGGDGIRSGWTLATIKERARKGGRLIRILYIGGRANTAELPLAGLGSRRSAALAIAKCARVNTL